MRFTSSTVASEGMYFFKKVNTSPGRWISVGEVNMSVVKSSCAVNRDLACNTHRTAVQMTFWENVRVNV